MYHYKPVTNQFLNVNFGVITLFLFCFVVPSLNVHFAPGARARQETKIRIDHLCRRVWGKEGPVDLVTKVPSIGIL